MGPFGEDSQPAVPEDSRPAEATRPVPLGSRNAQGSNYDSLEMNNLLYG